MAVLNLENVHAGYGEVSILNGITMQLEEGKAIAIIGANGHGKSTLLKTISGMVRLAKGRITFQGKELNRLAPNEIVELGVIHVPEGSQLFPLMTVKENLTLGAYSRRAWKKRNDNLKKVFNLFPKLTERRKQLANSLSGGERQMVALGRGLMSDAQVLMLDEPSLGLAPIVTDEVYLKIHEIMATGVSLIVVEQNIKRVEDFERLYLIENGEVRISGTSKEVLENPYLKSAYLG